ncbi:MAG TPA: FtsX-like permease family protein, partial [Chryseolinea sp.]|nr:FtsX-like permease family protein [Chryseolinea sp.]
DSAFFSVFPSLLEQGDPKSALTAKHSLVISDRIAKRIFGNEDPLGKIIAASEYNEQYEITGILKTGDVNTHLNVDFITPQDYIRDSALGQWEGPWRYTYVLLRQDIAKSAFELKLNRSIQMLARENERIKDVSLALQPLTEIHLHSNLKDEIQSNGNYLLVLILLLIGCVILIIAWINYLNLETSRFILRAKEVGIRRINGSSRADLYFQFMIEFFCVNVIASGLAVGLLAIGLPYLSRYTGLPFDKIHVHQPRILLSVLALFAMGLLTVGTYPAFMLSKINLAATLKGKFSSPVNLHTPRKVFLNFQFVSSMVLISFVLVVYKQLDFMKMSNKKIDLEKTISVLNPTVYSSQEEKNVGEGGYANFTNFKNKLLGHSQISTVSSSSAVPGEAIGFNYVDLVKRNLGDPYDPTGYKVLFVDYNFIPLFKLKLKAGRNYSPDNGEDENWSTLVLNESAVKALNFASPEDAIGKEIYFMPSDDWSKYKIVGVVEDYYHEAMKKNITPTIFFLNHNRGQQVYYSIKLNAGANPQDALRIIEHAWKTIFPEKPFEYFFLDEYYDQQFKSELHFGTIFTLFAGVATFIAGLGIFGMTLFEANAKIKEISIRKVLGASARSLVFLFSKKHLKIVLVAACLASPLIYVASIQWLESYPTRIKLSLMFFITPILLVATMVAGISAIQVLNAAQTNPVDSLKHE